MIPNKDIFCSSPWLHLRISYSGQFIPCRWMNQQGYQTPAYNEFNIRNMTMMEYFNSIPVTSLRTDLLHGTRREACNPCHYEESFNKVSGRLKQLYRSGLVPGQPIDSSVHYPMFNYSDKNNGHTDGHPFDLQIDLDSTCNGACIMCYPVASSRLHTDYKKLSKTSPILFKHQPAESGWATNADVLDKFITELKQMPTLDYIHFIGGETLVIDSFYTVCEALIDAGITDVTIGTTTNCTVFSPRLERIISSFRSFHMGLSIETVNQLNDYIRYPSKIDSVLSTIDKFITLRDKLPDKLHLTLRITPNVFSIFYIDELIAYMHKNMITGESCNIMHKPECLRMELIPDDLRLLAIEKLNKVVEELHLVRTDPIVNTRDHTLCHNVISAVAHAYIDFLKNFSPPDDVEKQRADLVSFITSFETVHHNKILDVAPEYADFLHEYGYI